MVVGVAAVSTAPDLRRGNRPEGAAADPAADPATGTNVGVAGAAVVGVGFGMARCALGVTLPDVRGDFAMSDLLLGIVASGTFVGYLAGLLLAMPLASRRGPRAPTTAGTLCAIIGCVLVALAPSPVVVAAGALLAGTAAGWVWAPYSDIVKRVAATDRHRALLARINTGTGGGFLLLAVVTVVAAATSWRMVWAGTAVVASVALLLNLRLVPALPPVVRAPSAVRAAGLGILRNRALLPPLLFGIAYSAGCTIYFTYASQAVRDSGVSQAAGALIFAGVAVTGTAAMWTGRMVAAVGSPRVAAGCLGAQGLALVLLAVAAGSVTVVLASSLVYGVGYMVGGATMAIWTAEAVPEKPGEAFTASLVAGAVSAIAAPTVIGSLIPHVGLPAVLLASGVLGGTIALVMTLGCRGRRRRRERPR